MNYDFEARADAIEALAPVAQGGAGVAVTVEAQTGSSRNNATLTTTPTYAAAQTGSGVQDGYKVSEIDGTHIKAGDLKFYLSPVQTNGLDIADPVPGSKFTLRGVPLRVVDRNVIQPADAVILYIVQLRGA